MKTKITDFKLLFELTISFCINHMSTPKQFAITLKRNSVVLSSSQDRLAAQFLWTTVGLPDVQEASCGRGKVPELSFHGLVRCVLGKDGVSHCAIFFDAFTLVRKCSNHGTLEVV